MPGDYTRVTFDPLRDFSRVRSQQGRVVLDADLNELMDAVDHRLRALALDVLGPCTAPTDVDTDPAVAGGFAIAAGGGSFTIGLGRLYLHGLVLDNHGVAPWHQERGLRDPRGGAAIAYEDQPYYPDPPAVPSGRHVVYVDAWDREVTEVERPELIDSAVGVGTAARTQTVWQVKVLPDDASDVTCSTDDGKVPGYAAATAPSAGRLTTAAVAVPADTDPCSVPPDGGYRGWDNRLYRVEVHDGGPLAAATFKWSRDNASVASAVLDVDSTRTVLSVASTGRDDVQRIREQAWVEIVDDDRELTGTPGFLAQVTVVDRVDDMTQQVTLSAALPGDFDPATDTRRTRLRQWDQGGPAVGADGTIPASAAVATGSSAGLVLEDGVQVTLAADPVGGDLKTGDYWVFAARSADASVEALTDAPPQGPIHYYGRLAIVDLPGEVVDCRGTWPPVCADGGCDCTYCVTPESHASGQLRVQDAVAAAGATGGTVCLSAGDYALDEPVVVRNANGLTLRGHGYLTRLTYQGRAAAILVVGSRDVRIEDLTVLIGSAKADGGGDGEQPQPSDAPDDTVRRLRRMSEVAGPPPRLDAIGVGIAQSVGVELRRCVVVDARLVAMAGRLATTVTHRPTAGPPPWQGVVDPAARTIAVATSAVVAGLGIRDCLLGAGVAFAPLHTAAVRQGLGAIGRGWGASLTSKYTLVVGLEIATSLLIGLREAVLADEQAMVMGGALVSDCALGSYAGPALSWSAAHNNAELTVRDSYLLGRGGGVSVGSSGVDIARSQIVAVSVDPKTAADGLAVVQPAVEGGVAQVRVRDCSITAAGSGVTIAGTPSDLTLADNRVAAAAGGIVMAPDASGTRIVVERNDVRLTRGTVPDQSPPIRAGIWLVGVTSSQVRDNRVRELASTDDTRRTVIGIAVEAPTSATIRGNTVSGIFALDQQSGLGIGIASWPSGERVDVVDNAIAAMDDAGPADPPSAPVAVIGLYVATQAKQPAIARLGARIAGAADKRAYQRTGRLGTPLEAITDAWYVAHGETPVRLTDGGVAANALAAAPSATVRGNHLDVVGRGPAIRVDVSGDLVLSDNLVRSGGLLEDNEIAAGAGVTGSAGVLVASANRVTATSASFTVAVPAERAAVVGNATSDPILLSGVPLQQPWAALNIVV